MGHLRLDPEVEVLREQDEREEHEQPDDDDAITISRTWGRRWAGRPAWAKSGSISWFARESWRRLSSALSRYRAAVAGRDKAAGDRADRSDVDRPAAPRPSALRTTRTPEWIRTARTSAPAGMSPSSASPSRRRPSKSTRPEGRSGVRRPAELADQVVEPVPRRAGLDLLGRRAARGRSAAPGASSARAARPAPAPRG